MKNNHTKLALLVAVFILAFGTSTLYASPEHDESAVKAMANILMHVNHFPSSAEKKTLKKIADDGSNSGHVRAIANAMMHMQHAVSSADRKALNNIADDSSADSDTRELASILSHFNHKPSRSDKEKLNDIAH